MCTYSVESFSAFKTKVQLLSPDFWDLCRDSRMFDALIRLLKGRGTFTVWLFERDDF